MLLSYLILSSVISLIYAQSCDEDHTSMSCSSSEQSQNVIRKRSLGLPDEKTLQKHRHYSLSRRHPAAGPELFPDLDDLAHPDNEDIPELHEPDIFQELADFEEEEYLASRHSILVDNIVPPGDPISEEDKLDWAHDAAVLSAWSVACFGLDLPHVDQYNHFFDENVYDILWNLLRDQATQNIYPNFARIYLMIKRETGTRVPFSDNRPNVKSKSESAPESIQRAIQISTSVDQARAFNLAIGIRIYNRRDRRRGLKFFIKPQVLSELVRRNWEDISQHCKNWKEWQMLP